MKGFVVEFKEFALKGNVIDLAVGVMIGAAFGKIVTSLVADLLTPIVSYITGPVNFTGIMIGRLKIGNFIQNTVDFAIVAVAIFIAVKAINNMKRRRNGAIETSPVGPLPPSEDTLLLRDIRDLLKRR